MVGDEANRLALSDVAIALGQVPDPAADMVGSVYGLKLEPGIRWGVAVPDKSLSCTGSEDNRVDGSKRDA